MDSKSIVLFSIKLGKELKDNDKPPSNVEELFVLNILEYKDRKFTSEQIANAKKGYYELTQEDVFAIEYNVSLFWSYMHNNTGIKDMIAIREAVGKGENEVKGKKVGYKMFFPSKVGLENISVKYNPTDLSHIDSKAEYRLKTIVLYYNSKYNKSQKEIVITNTTRTDREQAVIVYNNVKNKHKGIASNSMYKGYSGMFVEQELNKGTSENNIIDMLEAGIEAPNKTVTKQLLGKIKVPFTGFNHVNASKNTCDIGINNNSWSTQNFGSVLNEFMDQGKFLNTQTLPLGVGNETDCHHLVILV